MIAPLIRILFETVNRKLLLAKSQMRPWRNRQTEGDKNVYFVFTGTTYPLTLTTLKLPEK